MIFATEVSNPQLRVAQAPNVEVGSYRGGSGLARANAFLELPSLNGISTWVGNSREERLVAGAYHRISINHSPDAGLILAIKAVPIPH